MFDVLMIRIPPGHPSAIYQYMNFLLYFLVSFLFSFIFFINFSPLIQLLEEKISTLSAQVDKYLENEDIFSFQSSFSDNPSIEYTFENEQGQSVTIKEPLIYSLSYDYQLGNPMSEEMFSKFVSLNPSAETLVYLFEFLILNDREVFFNKLLDTYSDFFMEVEARNYENFNNELVYRILFFPGRFKYLEKMLKYGFNIEHLDFFIFNALTDLNEINLNEKVHFLKFLKNDMEMDILNTPIICPIDDNPENSNDLFMKHFEYIAQMKKASINLIRQYYPIDIIRKNWSYSTSFECKKRMFEVLMELGADLSVLNELNEVEPHLVKNQSLI